MSERVFDAKDGESEDSMTRSEPQSEPRSESPKPFPWSDTAPSTYPPGRELIRLSDLEFFGAHPSLPAWAHDDRLRIFWMNEARVSALGKTSVELGMTLDQIMPKDAADERNERVRRVIDSLEPDSFYVLTDRARVLINLFPIDERDFGHPGAVAISQENHWYPPVEADTLRTPSSDSVLARLSDREFEVFHLIARSYSTSEIAGTLHRSEKTVDKHIGAIHKALGTHSRADLVRIAVERGISHFNDEEWNQVVRSRSALRRGLGAEEMRHRERIAWSSPDEFELEPSQCSLHKNRASDGG